MDFDSASARCSAPTRPISYAGHTQLSEDPVRKERVKSKKLTIDLKRAEETLNQLTNRCQEAEDRAAALEEALYAAHIELEKAASHVCKALVPPDPTTERWTVFGPSKSSSFLIASCTKFALVLTRNGR